MDAAHRVSIWISGGDGDSFVISCSSSSAFLFCTRIRIIADFLRPDPLNLKLGASGCTLPTKLVDTYGCPLLVLMYVALTVCL